ncbi:sulfonate transport system permease protein [Nocardioides zeae]|uniref:Sulfonate transport system permease protein n=2 Tax=Nocardioides zeae TaxID=1457234 RepID=A0ACC6IKE2_9ACTN|nr:ABC transporter permease [Nocardioides zeae]MDQ1106677.1 sulfonate transport system permease protein [Nocardioides zeae]MDR6173660.1 sulfonate transport system permease protein [Nocardioides zeae]MDR6211065.1 sulfonate transport system permease protein [Nocardioides zeae]
MSGRLRAVALEAWLPVAVVSAWWFLSANSTSLYFPPLREILARFREVWLFDQAGEHLVPSLTNLAGGLAVGLVAAVSIGLLLGLLPRVYGALRPLVELARATPALALLPLLIAMLGIGSASKIALIAFGAFWPTLVTTIDGVRAVDPQVREMARTYRIGRGDLVRRVVLPSAAPQIIVGARTSVSIAVVVMVGSELFGATSGVGFFVLQAQRTYAITDMWAGLVLLGLLGYAINLATALVERRVLAWHRGLHGARPTEGRSA